MQSKWETPSPTLKLYIVPNVKQKNKRKGILTKSTTDPGGFVAESPNMDNSDAEDTHQETKRPS